MSRATTFLGLGARRVLSAALIGGLGLAQAAWINQGDGTVSDDSTGLIWDRCVYGQSGADCTGGSGPTALSWAGALRAAREANQNQYLGHADWRVPNRNELETLVTVTKAWGAFDSSVFPAPASPWENPFWTSSSYALDPHDAWVVHFFNGELAIYSKPATLFLRLVRGGGAQATFDLLAPRPGVCGSADGGSLRLSAPSSAAQLCSQGSASTVTADVGAYSWSCAGLNQGQAASCSAARGYTITASAGPGGSLGGPASQVVAAGATASFAVSAAEGYTASVSGCGGQLAAGNYTTAAVTVDCGVQASFALRTQHSAAAPGGAGTVDTALSGGGPACGFATVDYQSAASVSPPGVAPPAGYVFPYGVLSFRTAASCGAGASVNLTLSYPQPLPPGARFFKYGPPSPGAAPSWYEHPAQLSGQQLSYSVSDNGQGDLNPLAGVIEDPGGVAYWIGPGEPAPIPALGPWGLGVLAALCVGLGLGAPAMRRVCPGRH